MGPKFPFVPDEGQLGIADGPGALLPNGNVLVAASADFLIPPVHIFEFDGSQLIERPTIPNAANRSSAACNMLVLPTGQIMLTDGSPDVEIYTPADSCYDSAWAPKIS